MNVVVREKRADALYGHLHEFQTLFAGLVEFARNGVVFLRTRKAQRQVFELPLDLPDAEAIGERRIDGQRLFAKLFGARRARRREPAKRLQTTRELEEHHAQILTHCEEHAPERLGLHRRTRLLAVGARFGREIVEFAELRDKAGDSRAEALFKPLGRILNDTRHAEEISGCNEFGIVPNASKNGCDAVGMHEGGFPR